MECREITDLISDYSVGNVSGDTRVCMDAHLAECPSCTAELENLNLVMALVDGLKPIEPPADLWNGVYNRIAATQGPMTIWDRLRAPLQVKTLGWSLGAAISILLMVMLFVGAKGPGRQMAPAIHGSNELLQGHLIYTGTDLLSDPASINSKAVLAYRDNGGVRRP